MIYIAKGDVVQLNYELYAVANSEETLLSAVALRLKQEYPTLKEQSALFSEIQESTGVGLTADGQHPYGIWTGIVAYQADENFDALPEQIGEIYYTVIGNTLHFELISTEYTILEEYNYKLGD